MADASGARRLGLGEDAARRHNLVHERFVRCSPQGYIHGSKMMHGRRNTLADLERFTKKTLVVCGEHEEQLMKGHFGQLAVHCRTRGS